MTTFRGDDDDVRRHIPVGGVPKKDRPIVFLVPKIPRRNMRKSFFGVGAAVTDDEIGDYDDEELRLYRIKFISELAN